MLAIIIGWIIAPRAKQAQTIVIAWGIFDYFPNWIVNTFRYISKTDNMSPYTKKTIPINIQF